MKVFLMKRWDGNKYVMEEVGLEEVSPTKELKEERTLGEKLEKAWKEQADYDTDFWLRSKAEEIATQHFKDAGYVRKEDVIALLDDEYCLGHNNFRRNLIKRIEGM